jgi:outer membrane receptor protein involved in Fe transport
MDRDYRGLVSPALGPPAIVVRTDPGRVHQREDIFGGSQRQDDAQLDLTYQRTLGAHSLLGGLSFSRQSMRNATATYWGRLFDPRLPEAEVTSTDPREGLISYADHARLAGAIFLQDEWKPLESLAVTLGLRYDRYQDVDDKLILSPRVAVVWQPAPRHFIKYIYGQGFRPPSGFEQRGILFGSATGTRSILPERIFTGELAYATYLFDLRLQASAFGSWVVNNIVSVEDGDPNKPNAFANSGRAQMFGAELEVRGKYGWINYAVVDSRSRATTALPLTRTPFIAMHQLDAGAHWTFFEALTVSAQLYLRSPRFAPGHSPAPIQTGADFKARYRWRMVEVSAGVTNLIDQIYAFPLNDGGNYPLPTRGRQLYAGVKVDF